MAGAGESPAAPPAAGVRIWRFLLPVLVFAALVVVFALGLGRDPSYVPSPLIGKPAPGFDLPELRAGGGRVTPAAFLGKPWLLNVWATWCAGCREEHAALLVIARESGIPLVGLNWKDDPAAALVWLERLGDPYAAVAVDTQGGTAIDWGVYGAPETFLIGADGRVLYKHIAPLTMDVWQREFLPRLPTAGGTS